jgi:hypothetical protein
MDGMNIRTDSSKERVHEKSRAYLPTEHQGIINSQYPDNRGAKNKRKTEGREHLKNIINDRKFLKLA